ncbi:MAG: hypothetical protein KDH92_06745 [Chloroflexi bacterium]|nr:hypothetical protein [Chloroflexota bacterium]
MTAGLAGTRSGTARRRALGRSRGIPVALLLPLLSIAAAARPVASQQTRADRVWIEGEDADASTFNQHGWYRRDGLRLTQLSPGEPEAAPGDWLAHFSNGPTPAEASYRFALSEAGPHRLWLRASSYQVDMWYRLNGGPRQAIDTDSDPRETLRLNEPPAIDMRFISWFDLGAPDLPAGPNTLTVGLEPRRLNGGDMVTHGGIDAIAILSASLDWAPTGALRPDAGQQPAGPADWFPLIPTDDPFDPASVTDLSDLLESPAGLRGPIQRDGQSLRFADGSPVKLWGVNAEIGRSDALMQRQARHYAKQGINLVRLHPVQASLGLLQRDPSSGDRQLDSVRLDRLDRWFHQLKQAGIYMQWSLFYPHRITPEDGYPAELYAELPDSGPGKSSAGFVNFMPELQAAEWAWARPLLDHVNPYTGLRYADDPALAVIEVHNEDSIFWHYPLNPLAAGSDEGRSLTGHRAALQRLWMAWLQARYASDAQLLAAWGPVGGGSRPGDSLSNPAMPIYGAWEMEGDGPWSHKAEAARMGDFIRFLAETQAAYFATRTAQLRELGFRGVTVSTAWQAGGPAARLANLWSDSAADMIDRHSYLGGHETAPFWRITEGPIDVASHLSAPGTGILASGFEQIEDRPFMLSEWSQQPPNPWKAEIAPLVAFYGFGLQGWDASTHFSSALPRIGGGWPGDLTPWSSDTPAYIGQFAALARSVHEQHIGQAVPAAARRLALDDIFRGIDALEQDTPSGGWDAGPGNLATPREVFAIGRISTHFNTRSDDLGRSRRSDWDAGWNRAAGVVSSSTGELRWDYDKRVVTVSAPRTQAVIGFAGGGSYDLPDARIEVTTPFVSLILTALDQRPIGESAEILVTALARDQPSGARFSADGSRLENFGNPPLMQEPVQARITLPGARLISARPLDLHGVPLDREVERAANSVTIDGRYRAWRYLLRRDPPASSTPTAGAEPSVTPAVSPTGSRATPAPTGLPPALGPIHLPWLARFAP